MQDEVTQADREAAAKAFQCKPLMNGNHDADYRVQAFARHRQQAERGEVVEKMRDILSNLSSYLGAGMGDDNTTPEQFDARIRWGIDHVGRVYRDRAAQVVEECSKRPRTTWGEVKRAILDDTCLPTALPTPPEAA